MAISFFKQKNGDELIETAPSYTCARSINITRPPSALSRAGRCGLQINAGEFVSIIGKSGGGKTTLLNMITGIDRPTTGEVWVNNTAVHGMNENKMARWRGKISVSSFNSFNYFR